MGYGFYLFGSGLSGVGYLVLRKSNQEIADILGFSEGHVANSITDMNKKLGARNRRDLARIALDKHLVEFPKDKP